MGSVMNNSNSFAPTFIVGVPRSGTTLLGTLLGEHPLLSALYETKFLRNLLLHCEKACWFWGDSLSRRVVSYTREAQIVHRFRSECEKFHQKVLSFDEWTIDPATGRQTNRDFPSGISLLAGRIRTRNGSVAQNSSGGTSHGRRCLSAGKENTCIGSFPSTVAGQRSPIGSIRRRACCAIFVAFQSSFPSRGLSTSFGMEGTSLFQPESAVGANHCT